MSTKASRRIANSASPCSEDVEFPALVIVTVTPAGIAIRNWNYFDLDESRLPKLSPGFCRQQAPILVALLAFGQC
jgi:hypothetical protein